MIIEAINGWKGYEVGGFKSQVLRAKMKVTKLSLKKCISLNKKKTFSLAHLEDRLVVLDKKSENEGWSKDLRKTYLSILSKVWRSKRGDKNRE